MAKTLSPPQLIRQNEKIPSLPQLIRQNGEVLRKKTAKTQQAKAAKQLEGLMSHTPYDCEKANFKQGGNMLAARYWAHSLARKYNKVVLNSLFDLEREIKIPTEIIKVDRNEELLQVGTATIPIIAKILYGSSHWNYSGDVPIKRKEKSYGSDRVTNADFTVTAPAPCLTREVKEKASEAMALAYEVCAESLRNPWIRKYLLAREEISIPEQILEIVEPRLEIIWKPTLKSLDIRVEKPEPIDPDPALLLKFNNYRHLVTTWDVHDEEPLAHYLAEFSTEVEK